jgi:two-component sensor histidine kinase
MMLDGSGAILTSDLTWLHAVALLVTAPSCVVISLAVFGHYRRLAGTIAGYRELTLVGCISFLVFGLDGIVEFAARLAGYTWLVALANIFLAAAAVACAAVISLKLPRLSVAPLSRQLVDATESLEAERKARNAVVDTLTRLNDDLEQRVLQRTIELEEAGRRLERALAGTNISIEEQDRALIYTFIHNPRVGRSEELVGRRPEDVLQETAAEADRAVKQRVLDSGVAETVEVSLEVGGEVRWLEQRIEPVMQDGKPSGVITVSIDITSHKRYEQHLHRLLREITHRSKNLLAVVQGIARQTAETVKTPQDFIARFGARLQALSGAHDLLVRQSWQGVELRDLILREIETYHEVTDGRVTIAGDSEVLGVEVAQNLALGIHELATNAITYGALSVASGRIDISWQRTRVKDTDGVELVWLERGGPAVSEPQGRGFGRIMIERLVPRAVNGESSIAFEPEGLRWTLRFPVGNDSGES